MKRVLVPLLLMAQTTAPAELADSQLADARQEASARALMETIRCVVCQGQSIADSDASLAADMRAMVRERIAEGQSPEAIRRWLIARYGDYVTYDPPLGATTWPLWLAPFAMLVAGALLARSSFKRRAR